MKMKNRMKGALILIMGSTLSVISSCNKQDELSAQEIEDLKYMREEEKLARDVYLHAFDVYDAAIFENISSSEQKHMDKMGNLLNTYDIPDPAASDLGVFSNTELQNLYNMLIAKTDSSLLDALIVGAIIEDVDIFDLDQVIGRAERQDMIDAYEKLICGSQNHMRAFTNELEALGYTYTPKYISIAAYNTILAEENGHCGN